MPDLFPTRVVPPLRQMWAELQPEKPYPEPTGPAPTTDRATCPGCGREVGLAELNNTAGYCDTCAATPEYPPT